MGITINDPMPSPDFESLLNQLGIAGENMTIPSIPVCAGGPVETGRGFLLHSDDFHEKDTIVVDDNFAISGTIDSLRKIVERRAPRHMIFALGYAGWGAGQLERELHDNAWLSVPATTELVFGTRPDLMWEYAYSSIGINPMLLSGTAGRA
jgi:putative transcriptional regulator